MPLTPAPAGNPRPTRSSAPHSHLPAPISGPAAPPLLPHVGCRPHRSSSDGRESRPQPPPLILCYPRYAAAKQTTRPPLPPVACRSSSSAPTKLLLIKASLQ